MVDGKVHRAVGKFPCMHYRKLPRVDGKVLELLGNSLVYTTGKYSIAGMLLLCVNYLISYEDKCLNAKYIYYLFRLVYSYYQLPVSYSSQWFVHDLIYV